MNKTTVFILTMALAIGVSFNAQAGGSGGSGSCTTLAEEKLATAPVQIYLPDGNTKKSVGELQLTSRRSQCGTSVYEVLNVDVKLDDEIQPYGIKFKDNIIQMESFVSLGHRLKELVNSASSFNSQIISKTKITHFGNEGILNYQLEEQQVLFWLKPQLHMDSLVTAKIDESSGQARPLACSLNNTDVFLTLKANKENGLKTNLSFFSFINKMKLCN